MSDTRVTVGQRLERARHRWFLGRGDELELFRAAVTAPEPPFSVLHVHGPGGVGKTALLGVFADEARAAGARTLSLDARHFEPSPPGFMAALRSAAGLAGGDEAGTVLWAESWRTVLLVDTYELAAPLDDWLRERLLPELPASTLVVLAGREPPAPAWRAEPGWRDLLRVVALRNLRPEDSRAYLRAAAIPGHLHDSVLAFTHGHPLALSLVVDVLAQEEAAADAPAFAPEQAPDVVRELLARFVAGVPSPLHRQALEVCAHTRLTNEEQQRAALGAGDVHEVFEWLRSLSFIEQGPFGLAPHELARDLLDADLRWRDRERYAELHDRIRRHVIGRIRDSSGGEEQRALLDFMYLHRGNPFTQPYWEWVSFGQAWADPLTPADHAEAVAMTRRHEGDACTAMVAHWLGHQPEAFTAFRRGDGELLGFVAILSLDRAPAEAVEADPGTRAAWAYASTHAPPRPGEAVTHLRFLVDSETHQHASPAVNLVSVQATGHWLSTPRLAWNFISVTDTGYWSPLYAYIDYHRVEGADFEVGGVRFGTFAHDWRRVPPDAWLELMGTRELDVDFSPAAPAGQPQPLALSEPEFDQAVRRALRDLHRPDLLAANPLVRSRLVRERAAGQGTGADLAGALADLIGEAAGALAADPRDDKLLRAVDRTYLSPAPTKERAAELLGLPFSTYRRHLAQGVARVVGDLWERELYGA
jgi:hypothetical protein